jgi:hypothetical protein
MRQTTKNITIHSLEEKKAKKRTKNNGMRNPNGRMKTVIVDSRTQVIVPFDRDENEVRKKYKR